MNAFLHWWITPLPGYPLLWMIVGYLLARNAEHSHKGGQL